MKKNSVVGAMIWRLLERAVYMGGNFVITLILARLLSTSDYGTVSLIMVFVNLANTFVNGGFGAALIQKREVSQNDRSSVLFFSMSMALVLYLLLFFTAPFIGSYYRMENFSPAIRVTALLMFPAAISCVQIACVTREMRFSVLTASSVASMTLAAVVGITMAYMGFGVWALVAQQVVRYTTDCVAVRIMARVKLRGKISLKSLKEMVPFGSKVLATDLIAALFLDLRTMIIGGMYNASTLGVFERGKQFPQTIITGINSAMQSVLLPAYSKEQDDKKRVVEMLRQTIRISHFIMIPMLMGMACIAEPLIKVLLTDKWLGCVPFLQIFAFCYMMTPIQSSVAQAYKAIGDSGTTLKLEFIRKGLEIALLLVSLPFGIMAIALSTLVACILSVTITFFPNKKILGYKIREQVADIAPSFILSAIMSAVILFIGRFIGSPMLSMIVQILAGAAVYLLIAKLTNMSAYHSTMAIAKSLLKRK
ncbi:MAG: lipopolysaccharide biosynthesis protein [Clostridia bacterium]|nr:lipopolysaccharide biosynthesis protein [Clostridia bacterium]